MSDKATLEYNGKKYEFPVMKGTEDELAIDIKTLRSTTTTSTSLQQTIEFASG